MPKGRNHKSEVNSISFPFLCLEKAKINILKKYNYWYFLFRNTSYLIVLLKEWVSTVLKPFFWSGNVPIFCCFSKIWSEFQSQHTYIWCTIPLDQTNKRNQRPHCWRRWPPQHTHTHTQWNWKLKSQKEENTRGQLFFHLPMFCIHWIRFQWEYETLQQKAKQSNTFHESKRLRTIDTTTSTKRMRETKTKKREREKVSEKNWIIIKMKCYL